jgi:alcohol oxidase
MHGISGPIKVSFAEDEVNIGTQFLAVAGEYDKERGISNDSASDLLTCNTYGVSVLTLTDIEPTNLNVNAAPQRWPRLGYHKILKVPLTEWTI